MSGSIIYKYPLDLTGVNPNNLVVSEPHTLPAGINRAIVPNYGAFYSESLVVREVSTGKLLLPKQQYKAAQLYQDATEASGKEVCSIIVVTDTDVESDLEVSYQVVGGDFSYSVSALRTMLEGLDLDARPVLWGDVLGKPSAYPASPHLHDVGDVYGFEYLLEGIESLRTAILTGDSSYRDTILIDLELRSIAEHVGSHNAHGVSKYQIGLDNVVDKKPMTLSSVNAASFSLFNNYVTNSVVVDAVIEEEEDDYVDWPV